MPTRQTAEAGPNGTVVFTTTPAQAGPAGPPDTRSGLPVTAGWSKAAEFCRVAGMRLPTEAEWEYACRAGVQAPRYGELDAIAWHRGNSDGRNHPVGTKAANALGFHDMIGNAYEWVNDLHAPYPQGPVVDPTGPSTGTTRILRGGSFFYERTNLRSSKRMWYPPNHPSNRFGFRVARSP